MTAYAVKGGELVRNAPCTGEVRQQWRLFNDGRLVLKANPKLCLDATTASNARPGTRVRLSSNCPPNGAIPFQTWELKPNGQIANRGGLCLSVGSGNGQQVITQGCSQKLEQKQTWKITRTEDKTKAFKNARDSLEKRRAEYARSLNPVQKGMRATQKAAKKTALKAQEAQRYGRMVADLNKTGFKLATSQNMAFCLSATGGASLRQGMKLSLNACPVSVAPVLIFGRNSSLQVKGKNLCLDVPGGKDAARVQLQLSACNGSKGQQFYWKENGKITLSKMNNKCVAFQTMPTSPGQKPNNVPIPGMAIWTETCSSAPNQVWKVAK